MDKNDVFITAVGYIGKESVLAKTYIVEKGSKQDKEEIIRRFKLMNHNVDTVVLHELKSINFQREGVYKV